VKSLKVASSVQRTPSHADIISSFERFNHNESKATHRGSRFFFSIKGDSINHKTINSPNQIIVSDR